MDRCDIDREEAIHEELHNTLGGHYKLMKVHSMCIDKLITETEDQYIKRCCSFCKDKLVTS